METQTRIAMLWLSGLLLPAIGARALAQIPIDPTQSDVINRHSDQDGCGDDTRVFGTAGIDGVPDASALPTRLYVRADATGAESGRCWINALTDLQVALAKARTNPQITEIWVAQGTYTPDRGAGDRTAAFQLEPGLKIFGGFIGNETKRSQRNRDPLTNQTVLSGDLAADDATTGSKTDNSFHVVDASTVDDSAVLDGFTVAGGWADGAQQQRRGGGVFANLGAPTIRWCLFTDNAAYEGGAIYINAANPKLKYCGFLQNAGLDGAAVYATAGAAPSIEFSTFLNDAALGNGGAVYLADSSVSILHSRLLGEQAVAGGAIFASANSHVEALSCLINACVASGHGGGLALMDSSTGELVNCTVAFNRAGPLGGGLYVPDGGALQIDNAILWGNSDSSGLDAQSMQLWHGADALVTVAYSCVQAWNGALGGMGNIGADPMFINPDGTAWADLRLGQGSACIDAADSDAFTQVIVAMRGSTSAFYVDVDQQPRLVDDPHTVDTGSSSSGAVIDMGAAEFQGNYSTADPTELSIWP